MPSVQSPTRDVRPEKQAYRMPRPIVSKIVRWFPDRFTESGFPAVVTEVSDRSVAVSIMFPNQYALECKSGVRHRSDPERQSTDNSGDGLWDYADDGDEELGVVLRRLDAMQADHAKLLARVEAIEKELSK